MNVHRIRRSMWTASLICLAVAGAAAAYIIDAITNTVIVGNTSADVISEVRVVLDDRFKPVKTFHIPLSENYGKLSFKVEGDYIVDVRFIRNGTRETVSLGYHTPNMGIDSTPAITDDGVSVDHSW